MSSCSSSGHRLTIRSADPDPRAAAIAGAARDLGLPGASDLVAHVADVVFVDGPLSDADLDVLAGFLVDPLLQTGSWGVPTSALATPVEVTFHAGVTDVAAAAVLRAAEQLGVPVKAAATGRRV